MNKYENPKILARYLEAEWADWLLQRTTDEEFEPGLFAIGTRTIPFYKTVAHQLVKHIPEDTNVLDVGAGLCRLGFELSLLRPDLEVVTFDTSLQFTKMVRDRFATENNRSGEIPVIAKNRDGFAKVMRTEELNLLRQKFQSARVRVSSEKPQSGARYGCVVSCNVVDRVDDQKNFVSELLGLLKPQGVLAIATPFDYDEHSTEGVTDILELLPHDIAVLHRSDIDYVFRITPRKIVDYKSSLLIAKKEK